MRDLIYVDTAAEVPPTALQTSVSVSMQQTGHEGSVQGDVQQSRGREECHPPSQALAMGLFCHPLQHLIGTIPSLTS